ncbi:DMT family transporter [Aeromonas eucrenophila]|uniref:DMT family transporter n=1 Tax=Aeromonas eucrenophila TaxID=649 RepID=A0ABW0YGH9_9GAMM|nr:DMT family transporter [Aeromonas eucrenophila]
MPLPRLALLTLFTLLAFAANSLLCRLALFEERMDPALFTLLRLTSGALVLLLLCAARSPTPPRQGDWGGALALLVYAAAFSFAYLTLTTGTGALLLFAAVQLSMLAPPLLRGERLPARQWAGLLLAMAGLVLLLLPGIQAPDLLGAVLMVTAGIAWACYTLRASRFGDPVAANAGHFLRASLPAALLYLLLGRLEASPAAIGYALASGALASGLGYALWYSVLPQLGRTLAASVQLLVPLLAAMAGLIWLDESWSLRLLLSSLGILGGIALVIAGRPPAGDKP